MGEPRKKKKPNEATEKGYTERMSKNILGKEREIRKNKDESLHVFTASGNPVIQIQGKGAAVRFNAKDVPQNSILTHNHPRALGKTGMRAIGNSFSIDDIRTAVATNAKEIRAVTPTYTFSMKRPKGGWGVDANTAAKIFRQEDVLSLVKRIRNDFDKVYVYPHWGKEGEYTRWPSPRQRNLARRWIDAGADGVFGSHSHVFQGKEEYKGKPIYYSLGNYYFPHPESKLYEGTDVGLCVEVRDNGTKVVESFVKDGKAIAEDKDVGELRAKLDAISEPLTDWTTWKWAKAIGPFNLKKNTASWKIRLRKNFIKTFPKFLVWQFLPKTLLFRVAGWCD